MGRKAKLKQLKRQVDESSSKEVAKPNLNNTEFVQELTEQGYDLKQMKQSPEIPDRDRPYPQL